MQRLAHLVEHKKNSKIADWQKAIQYAWRLHGDKCAHDSLSVGGQNASREGNNVAKREHKYCKTVFDLPTSV